MKYSGSQILGIEKRGRRTRHSRKPSFPQVQRNLGSCPLRQIGAEDLGRRQIALIADQP